MHGFRPTLIIAMQCHAASACLFLVQTWGDVSVTTQAGAFLRVPREAGREMRQSPVLSFGIRDLGAGIRDMGHRGVRGG